MTSFGVTCTHELDELVAEFEVRLPVHVVAGRGLEEEAEVYVDDVAELVYHDVAVVSVLDLQQVAHHAVRSHADHKVTPCLLQPTTP